MFILFLKLSRHLLLFTSPPLTASLCLSHPVSGEHLSSVLVLDLDDSWRLDPGLTVHLDGNPLITQDGDLHCSTLIQTEKLQLDAHILTCVSFSYCS